MQNINQNKTVHSFQTKAIQQLGGCHMSYQCFYCTNETEENGVHHVTFHMANSEREELLCDECYQEWLQGIKG